MNHVRLVSLGVGKRLLLHLVHLAVSPPPAAMLAVTAAVNPGASVCLVSLLPPLRNMKCYDEQRRPDRSRESPRAAQTPDCSSLIRRGQERSGSLRPC